MELLITPQGRFAAFTTKRSRWPNSARSRSDAARMSSPPL